MKTQAAIHANGAVLETFHLRTFLREPTRIQAESERAAPRILEGPSESAGPSRFHFRAFLQDPLHVAAEHKPFTRQPVIMKTSSILHLPLFHRFAMGALTATLALSSLAALAHDDLSARREKEEEARRAELRKEEHRLEDRRKEDVVKEELRRKEEETHLKREEAKISDREHELKSEEHLRQKKEELHLENHAAAHEHLRMRFDRLSERWPAGKEAGVETRVHRERIYKTREYLDGLIETGTPVVLIDTWTDALMNDEIVTGMPADLMLNYWGTPYATQAIIVDNRPSEVWTYRLRPEKTVEVVVSDRTVTTVRRI